jgi:hypothetical protein
MTHDEYNQISNWAVGCIDVFKQSLSRAKRSYRPPSSGVIGNLPRAPSP